MEDYILINNITKIDHLRAIVRQDLREIGVKLPKSKKIKKLNQSRNTSREDLTSSRVFGDHLYNTATTFIEEYGYVPSFLVDASTIIESHLDSEGIFRKSGSVNRQKELKQVVEEGKSLAGSNVYDVSALVKQFFRELPEPLFSPIFHDAFVKCYQLPLEKEPTQAILELCLCLPLENIGALRFMLHVFSKIASHSDKNKMTASNLALVMSPNFMHSNKGVQKMNNSDEKMLHMEVAIIEILIKNCKYVGMVNSSLRQQATLMSECFGTDDDLDASDDNTLQESRTQQRKKKRKRSGSLTGFVSSIASGIAKLRRSTDGRSINMSNNSTYPNELSIASNASESDNPVFDSNATPCVMKKRRASGEVVPFSTTKKKAILGNLPQKSALASTPFTPASTVKRNNYRDDSCFTSTSETPRLNCTTPCMGTKTPRKKLNLFNSPGGSNKKVKRQASVARMNSPNPREKNGKNRNIFRRLSGTREKIVQEDFTRVPSSGNVSPKSTVSDSALTCCNGSIGMGRSASSQSVQDSDLSGASGGRASTITLNKGFSYDSEMYNYCRGVGSMPSSVTSAARARSADRVNTSGLSQGNRSKSVDSPGLKRGQPNTVQNGLLKSKSIDKSSISGPCPSVIPVMTYNEPDLRSETTTPLRRSRRDEFEEQNRLKKMKSNQKGQPDAAFFNRSVSSQLDESLMAAVLAPPHGFGDQTMQEEGDYHKTSLAPPNVNSNGEDTTSDKGSVAGFSTISGGTVLQRTESGNYTNDSMPSQSLKSSVSSCMNSEHSLQPSVSKGSVFSDSSVFSESGSEKIFPCPQGATTIRSSDTKEFMKVPDETFIDVGGVDDTYVTLQQKPAGDGEYVSLRKCQQDKKLIVNINRTGIDLLKESYVSEEDSSSSCFKDDETNTVPVSQEELQKVSSRPNIHRKKSISAEDLQCSPRVSVPIRSRSLYLTSPMKKFNYKPHLEISKETHRILARAGYMKVARDEPLCKDIQVPVKSPKRSSHREEMMASLRSSFHERINSSRLGKQVDSNQSVLSSGANLDQEEFEDTSQILCEESALNTNNPDNSLLIGWERLSIKSQNSSLVEEDVEGDRERKTDEVESDIDRLQKEAGDSRQVANLSQISEEEDSIQAKEPLTEQESLSCGKVGEHDTVVESSSEQGSTSSAKSHFQNNKSLTLSGFLDKEIMQSKGPLRIKRAELTMPKHDSVVNIKEQKAGLVAENIKHFSHRSKHGKMDGSKPPSIPPHKRGTSPIRIPTIFAKSEEKVKQYKEIAHFIRERTGQKNFMSLPQVPPTPKRQSTTDLAPSKDSDPDNSVCSALSSRDDNKSQQGEDVNNSSSSSSPQAIPKLSESLMEKVDLLYTPSANKARHQQREKDSAKSPLQESTNTSLSSFIESSNIADSIRLRTAGGLTPHRLPLKSESLPSQRNQRPQIKRLKGARSPRRVRPTTKSPHRVPRAPSPLTTRANSNSSLLEEHEDPEEAKTVMTSVLINLEEKEYDNSVTQQVTSDTAV